MNEYLVFIVMYILWVRYYNYIVIELYEVNLYWDGNILYYEIRKIMGVMM